MLVILYTDALLFLLIGCVVAAGWFAARDPLMRERWQSVARSRMGIVCIVVLLSYVVIGVLDSLHYREKLDSVNGQGEARYSTEILSAFDWLVTPLRTQEEKTYSSPLATHLYTKETVQLENGQQARIYPRLKHAGKSLDETGRGRWDDIRERLLISSAVALYWWLLLCVVIVLIVARRNDQRPTAALKRVLTGRANYPVGTLLITLGMLIWLVVAGSSIAVEYHVLGTDKIGQDVFYQTLKSIRTGLLIGTLTTLIMLPFAVMLGILAGYFRRWIDDVIQYVYTTLNSIPGVLLIAAAVLMLNIYMNAHADDFTSLEQRADLRLLFLCLILGITSWTNLCRLLRGETLKLREAEYVQAATAFGVPDGSIMWRHVMPNLMHIVLIVVVLDFSGLVLAEAVLSYVGIGVDPSTNSWGNMINGARLEMAREPIVWWSLAAAFIFMFVLVLAANLFADVVRDAFDPRTERG